MCKGSCYNQGKKVKPERPHWQLYSLAKDYLEAFEEVAEFGF